MLIPKDAKLITENGQERMYNQLKYGARVYINEFDISPFIDYKVVKRENISVYTISTKDREITLVGNIKIMTNAGFVFVEDLIGKDIMFVVPKETNYGVSYVSLEQRRVTDVYRIVKNEYEGVYIGKETLVVNGAYVKVAY